MKRTARAWLGRKRREHAREHRVVIGAGVVRGDNVACQHKHRHPDQMTALAAAATSFELGKVRDTLRLFAYRCPSCRGWHLTKNAEMNRGAAHVTREGMVW